jgi:hypothetical protein
VLRRLFQAPFYEIVKLILKDDPASLSAIPSLNADASDGSQSSFLRSRAFKVMLIGGLIILVIVIVAVTVPLILNRKTSQTTTTASTTTTTATTSTTSTTAGISKYIIQNTFDLELALFSPLSRY